MQRRFPAYNHQVGRWAHRGALIMRRYIPLFALALAGVLPATRAHRSVLRAPLPQTSHGPTIIGDDDDDGDPPPPPKQDDDPPPPPPPEDDGDGD